MNDIETINDELRNILEIINDGGLNYAADIRFFEAVECVGKNAVDTIEAAIGNPIILGNTFVASTEDVILELRTALSHIGESSCHPNTSYVGTNKHKTDVYSIVNNIERKLKQAQQITGFWLKKGHPFYPVFWDFAFIVEFKDTACVLIGSSSD